MDENINENVLLEVTNATADGYVEVAFNDRNKRCYLQFSLPELMTQICRAGISKE